MPRIINILKVLGVGALGAVIGYIIGSQFDRSTELALTGFAFGALIGLWRVTTYRRWVIAGFLALLYGIAFITGGFFAFGAAIGATILTFIWSAVIVRHLYPGGEQEALMHHLRLALGMTRGFLIIQNGKIEVPKGSKGLLFGPHELVVKPHHAVVLERGSQQTRIVGPTHIRTDPFEYVQQIIPLSRLQERIDVTHVHSKDHVPVTVTLCATYGIKLPDGVVLGSDSLTPIDHGLLQQMLLNTPDWKRQTRSAIEAASRKLCHEKTLDELLDPSEHEKIETAVLSKADTVASSWKVTVSSVMIENVQPPPEIKAAHTSMRIAVASGEIHKQRAAATYDALMKLADAYQNVKAKGMTANDINRYLLREVMETLFSDPANKFMLSPELNSLLQSLRK